MVVELELLRAMSGGFAGTNFLARRVGQLATFAWHAGVTSPLEFATPLTGCVRWDTRNTLSTSRRRLERKLEIEEGMC